MLARVLGPVAMVLASWPASALAADRMLADGAAANVDAYAGTVVWDRGVPSSDGNLAGNGWRIAVRQAGEVHVVGRRFDFPPTLDLGTDVRGRLTIVYSLCSPRGCGVRVLDPRTGRERAVRLRGDHPRCRVFAGLAGAIAPSISRGRIVYFSTPCRGPTSVMLRLASGATRRLGNDSAIGVGTDIVGDHVLISDEHPEPALLDNGSRVILFQLHSHRRRTLGEAYNEGPTSDMLKNPVLDSGLAYYIDDTDRGSGYYSQTLHRVPVDDIVASRLRDYSEILSGSEPNQNPHTGTPGSIAVSNGRIYYTVDDYGVYEDTTSPPVPRSN